MDQQLTINQASDWASQYLGKIVTPSNIAYLIQYGKIKKVGDNGSTQLFKNDLLSYYQSLYSQREISWRKKLGSDLNWHLSFDNLREIDTTKHVHRLHPYKGKFIPQLVEYFLDSHIDEFKKEVYFRQGDIVLDPFCGSGTTLVQANELGLHAIGIDISSFNAFISNIKIGRSNLVLIRREAERITQELTNFYRQSKIDDFEIKLTNDLYQFNKQFFPVPEYKYKLNHGQINEKDYTPPLEKKFIEHYYQMVSQYQIELNQNKNITFLDKWYLKNIRDEVDFVFGLIKKIDNVEIRKVLGLILSRTIRSCRATTHSDLATLINPVVTPYYCQKHGKICKPLLTILNWWQKYSIDTVSRLSSFDKIRSDTYQYCLSGDSREIDIYKNLEEKNRELADLVKSKKIKGIFSSPPYVGLIDYHEQHAYAYDLLGFKRNDELEIGSLYKGQGNEARRSYVEGITEVLLNCHRYLADDFDIFLVANDKYNLYPEIAQKSGLRIVDQFKRPVLNRTERDKNAYSEIIFRMKEGNRV